MFNRVTLPTPILSHEGRDNCNSSRNSVHSSEGGSGLPTMIIGNNASTSIPTISPAALMTASSPHTSAHTSFTGPTTLASQPFHIFAPPTSGSLNVSTVDPSYRNLYISGLPFSIRDDELREFFSNYGKIESAKVMIDVSTGMSRGFAFVLFNRVEEGCAAFGSLNGKDVTIKGETFKMKMMPSEHDGHCADIPCETIYVRNIPVAVPESEVRAHFANFGTIVSYGTRPIEHPHHNRNHGLNATGTEPLERLLLATVTFASAEEAKRAIDATHQMHPFSIHGSIPVLAKFADTKQAKDARKAKRTRDRNSHSSPPQNNYNITTNSNQTLPPATLPQLPQMLPYTLHPHPSSYQQQQYTTLPTPIQHQPSQAALAAMGAASTQTVTPSSSINVNLSAFSNSTSSRHPQHQHTHASAMSMHHAPQPTPASISLGGAASYNQDLSGIYPSQLVNMSATPNGVAATGFGNHIGVDSHMEGYKQMQPSTFVSPHMNTGAINASQADSVYFFQGLVTRTSEGLLVPVQIQQFHPVVKSGPSAPDAFASSALTANNHNLAGMHHMSRHAPPALYHPQSGVPLGTSTHMVMLPPMGSMFVNE